MIPPEGDQRRDEPREGDAQDEDAAQGGTAARDDEGPRDAGARDEGGALAGEAPAAADVPPVAPDEEPADTPASSSPEEPEAAPAWTLALPDEAATAALGRTLASGLRGGDLVTLAGGLGAGKTTLARAVVRAWLGDPAHEVPSPSFALVQLYEGPRGPLVHADLHRLGRADELAEIGWDEAADEALVLVEWAERLGPDLPPDRLDVALDLDEADPASARRATLTAHGAMGPRLTLLRAVHETLARIGLQDAARVHVVGDASTRAYERLVTPEGTAILMIAPPRPDGPPVRDGLPYSRLARLAEDVTPFVAVARHLGGLGLSAPTVVAGDFEAGVLVLEDLGSEGVLGDGGPEPERYGAATDLLARLHGEPAPEALPATLPGNAPRLHALPPYDRSALLAEVELLLDWRLPRVEAIEPDEDGRAEFLGLWAEALAPLLAAPPVLTLRDYHSPNLLWLPEREGLARVGLLDFQDAVAGHPAYDVASLLQDARVTVPEALELRLLGRYALARRAADPGFDPAAFAAAYAVLGAQRAAKVLGVFARLAARDGKPGYLRHVPRVEAYLRRNLAHPALAPLRPWFEARMPGMTATA